MELLKCRFFPILTLTFKIALRHSQKAKSMKKQTILIYAIFGMIALETSCTNNDNFKTSNMNKVMWFDIPAEDLDKSAQFYESMFGWNILPKDPNDKNNALSFRPAITSPSNEENLTPKNAEAINGGIVTRDIGITQPTILIQVESIEQKIKQIQNAGGKLIKGKTHLPLAGGYFAYITDLDENIIGLWEVEK